MVNNTKIAKFGLAAMAAVVLCACGTGKVSSSSTPASSSSSSSAPVSSSQEDDYSFAQNSTSIAETIWNLQVVGSIDNISAWNPTEHVGDKAVHFTRVSKMLYTLKGVVIALNNEFKFTFDDTWKNDFGWKGFAGNDTTAIKEYITPADQAGVDAGNDSNIKCIKACTLDFEYHPFFVAEAGVSNKLVIKLHA